MRRRLARLWLWLIDGPYALPIITEEEARVNCAPLPGGHPSAVERVYKKGDEKCSSARQEPQS